MRGIPNARLSSKVPYLEFDILILPEGSPPCEGGMASTATHLNRFHVETNRCTVTVSVNGIHGYSLTYHSLGIVETTSPI